MATTLEPASNVSHPDRSHAMLYCLAIAAITFAVYSPVRHNGFVWDTIHFVLQNPWLQNPGASEFKAMFTQAYVANWQPMVWLSHALDFALFDHHDTWHHFSNVAYHAADACLIYWLTLRVLDSSLSWRQREVVASITALVFAVHPQHVESAAWLVERKDTLYALFTVSCLISYLWIRREQVRGWRTQLPLVFLALALMAKAMAVTVPVVLLLLDVYPLRRWRGDVAGVFKLVVEKWPYWLLSLVVIGITLRTQQLAMVSLDRLPVWARPLDAINNSFFYVYRYLVPVDLSPIYPYPPDTHAMLQVSFWLPGTLFLIVSLGVSAYLWLRGIRPPLLMLIFYLVTLLPVSGLIAVGPAKALDYYSYLSTLPLGLGLALGIVYLWRRAGMLRSVVAGVAASYLLALCVLSLQQVKFWRNELTLWTRAYQLYPDSAYINRNLAGAYFSIGDYRNALVHAQISARHSELGEAYLEHLEAALRGMQGAAGK